VDIAGLWDPEPGYFNTASYGLPPRPAFETLQAVLADWRAGHTSWEPWDDYVAGSRAAFARLVGVDAADVAVGATVSEQLGLVAAALPDRARVLVNDDEFTSNLFPWLAQAHRGVTVTSAPLSRLAEAVDAGTTLVAFSAVHSATGEVAPYDEIVSAARHHGALVAVDATQACGWLPLDAAKVDALAAHAYKWLMSPRGSSFLVVRGEIRDRMRPLAAGWYAGEDPHASYYGPPLRLAGDSRRFDTSPAWFSWVGTRPALEVVERIGVEAIHDHDVRLANRLREGLGLPPGNSAIVSVDVPGAEARLTRAGLRASVRAGLTRLACHVYTTDRDVDEALTALRLSSACAYLPRAPSASSRRISRWPLCRAVSSVRCSRTQRSVTGSARHRSPFDGVSRSRDATSSRCRAQAARYSASNWVRGTSTAIRNSRSGSSSVHGAVIVPPSRFFSIHELSTQRRWLTSPDIVISGESGSGARRASASDKPAHLACTVSRA